MHIYLAALTLALAAPAPPAADVPSAEVARAIAGIEERLEGALARRDRSGLEPLLAEGFSWIHASDGRIDSREVWLANAAQGMALSGQRNARTEHGATLTAFGAPEPHTVVRVARVRLVDPEGKRESWMRQTHVLVRGTDGAWRLAWGQGVVMYEGAPLDGALHARYAGTYPLAPGRVLTLAWEDGALLATFPNGSRTQIFLASPTEEAARTAGAGRLRFTLGPDGRPTAAALVRDGQEVWRAPRTAP
jgi:uncharacterized protein DUF4440